MCEQEESFTCSNIFVCKYHIWKECVLLVFTIQSEKLLEGKWKMWSKLNTYIFLNENYKVVLCWIKSQGGNTTTHFWSYSKYFNIWIINILLPLKFKSVLLSKFCHVKLREICNTFDNIPTADIFFLIPLETVISDTFIQWRVWTSGC